jgi:hypothetical protein
MLEENVDAVAVFSDAQHASRGQRRSVLAVLGRAYRRHPLWMLVLTLVVVTILVLAYGGYLLGWDWTGFKGNTFWDWLSLLITENRPESPRLEPGEEWPPRVANSARLCANAAVAPCQLNRVWAFRGKSFPRVKACTYYRQRAARNRDAQLGGASSPYKHLPTAAGLADMVTVSVPPE